MKNALIVVDVQNDFCPGGGYPVPDGDKVVGPINNVLRWARQHGWLVVFSRDWHKRELFEDESKVHCVQDTNGALFHKDLMIRDGELVVNKGADDLDERHYSAFNGDDVELDEVLKQSLVSRVYICGLAYDYCVARTALDAVKHGYQTIILTDAVRAVKNSPAQIAELERGLKSDGVVLMSIEQMMEDDGK